MPAAWFPGLKVKELKFLGYRPFKPEVLGSSPMGIIMAP